MTNYYAGYYQVGNQKYTNKIFAAIDATDTAAEVGLSVLI